MSRARRKRLPAVRDRFVAAVPGGARIRTRWCPALPGAGVLRRVGTHLGGVSRADLGARLAVGEVPAALNQRTDRTRGLTPLASSRWAGSVTRAGNGQDMLALRAGVATLACAIKPITARAAAPAGGKGRRGKGLPRGRRTACQAAAPGRADRTAGHGAGSAGAGRPPAVAGGR